MESAVAPISARWVWTQKDLEQGRTYFSKARGLTNFWRYAVLGFCGIFLLRQFVTKDDRIASLVVFGILCFAATVAVLIVKFAVSPILRKREFSKRPDAGQEISWAISDQSITITTSNTKSEVEWSAFYKVFHTPCGFLFLANQQIFYFIPRRAFAGENSFENARTLARKNSKFYGELK